MLGLQKYYRNKNDACPPLSYPFLSFCPVSFSSLLLLHRIHTSFGPQKKHGEEHNPQPQSSRSPGIVTAGNLTSAEAKCGFALLLYLRPPIHSVRIVARFLLLRGNFGLCLCVTQTTTQKQQPLSTFTDLTYTPPFLLPSSSTSAYLYSTASLFYSTSVSLLFYFQYRRCSYLAAYTTLTAVSAVFRFHSTFVRALLFPGLQEGGTTLTTDYCDLNKCCSPSAAASHFFLA